MLYYYLPKLNHGLNFNGSMLIQSHYPALSCGKYRGYVVGGDVNICTILILLNAPGVRHFTKGGVIKSLKSSKYTTAISL